MPQWAPFTAVSGVLAVLLLLLARQSQQLLGDADGNEPVDPERGPEERGDPTQSGAGPPPDHAGSSAEGTEQERKPVSDEARPADGGHPGVGVELTPRMLLANVAVTQGGVIVLVVAAAWYFAIPADALGVGPASTGVPGLGLGVAFGVVLWIGNELSTWLADAAGAAYDESLRELLAPASAGGWLILFGAVLPTIAVAEEVLFRAALIGVPAAGFGLSPWLLAAVSSVAFALGHGAQGRVGIVVTGLLGFVLAAGYIRSGSLLVVIVAHYLVNAAEFFVHEYLGVGSALAGRG